MTVLVSLVTVEGTRAMGAALILHGLRIFKGWTVQIGPYSVSMTVSWVGLVVAGLLAIWGFSLSA